MRGNKLINYKNYLTVPQNLSRIYKYTVVLVLALLLLIALSFVSETLYSSEWFVYLMFLLPVLWVLWLICAVLEAKNPVRRLALLWCLIDLAALGMLYQLIGVDYSGVRSGADYLLAIAFFPFILPLMLVGFIMPMLDKVLETLIGGSGYIVHGTSGVFRDWLAMSILSAVLAVIFAVGCRLWRKN